MDSNKVLESLEQVLGPVARRAGDEHRFICPKCDDQSGHLDVNLIKGVFHCILCGYGGRVKTLLRGTGVKYAQPKKEKKKTSPIPDEIPGYVPLKDFGFPRTLIAFAIDYLENRKLDPSEVDCGLSGEIPGRVVFPLRQGGKIVSFQGRALDESIEPKTLNGRVSEGWLGREQIVYQSDEICQGDMVMVTEGIFDALAVHGRGLSPVVGVSLLGSTISRHQRDILMSRRPGRIVVFLDGDAPKKALAVARLLAQDLPGAVHLVQYPVGLEDKDPAALPNRIRDRLIREAPLLDIRLVARSLLNENK